MKAITQVTVEYEDGGSESWTGTGTVKVTRTPREAQGVPLLDDSDISYVEARVVFDRDTVNVGAGPDLVAPA